MISVCFEGPEVPMKPSLRSARLLVVAAACLAAVCAAVLAQPELAAAGTRQPACVFVSDPNLIAIVVQGQDLTQDECSAANPALAQVVLTYGLTPLYYGSGLPARFGSVGCQYVSSDGTVLMSFYDTALTRFSHFVTQAACSAGPPAGFFTPGGD
jgi:hypothetical protein